MPKHVRNTMLTAVHRNVGNAECGRKLFYL